jgi:hypothetical protein
MKPKTKRPPTLFEQRRGPNHHDLIQEITMARRVLSWTTALRDLQRDRVSPSGTNPMYLRSLERAREADARREAAQKRRERQEGKNLGRADAVTCFLAGARHNRLSAQCDPDQRDVYLGRARYWLGQAAATRRAEGSRLPS